MKRSDSRIRERLLDGVDRAVSESAVRAAVERSVYAFCAGEAQGRLSRTEFLYRQLHFIRKRWWALQGLLLFGLWLLLSQSDTDYTIRRGMGVAAPLFAVLLLPELNKSRCAGTMEVEGAAYYSLRQVYAARLTLYAAVDLLFLGVFGAAAVCVLHLPVREFVFQFFLPFNVTCGICFRTLYSRLFSTELYAELFCMLWAAAWLMLVTNEKAYCAVSVPAWYILSAASALYLAYGVYRGRQKCETLWEEEMLWN